MKPLILLAAGLLAAPALAQTPTPPTPPAPPPQVQTKMFRSQAHGPMFGSVSPEARKALVGAMRATSREERQALQAARDRINQLAAAERLDVNALRQAMEAERRLVDAAHAKRQAALLAALQSISAEDRRAFAADASKGRQSVDARSAEWRKWAEDFRQHMRKAPPAPPAPPAAPGGIE